MSKINLNQVWDDAKAMGAANWDLLGALAGMFVLLPLVVQELLLPKPSAPSKSASFGEALQVLSQYYVDNWMWLLPLGLFMSFGLLTMFILLLRPGHPTVAESLKGAAMLLPGYFLACLGAGVACATGFMLFILPGLYIFARLSLIGPLAAAENCVNPIEQLKRSFALSRGNGWRIFFMHLILTGAAMLGSLVVTILITIVAELLFPEDLGALVVSVVICAIAAAAVVVSALITAALYRATAGVAPVLAAPPPASTSSGPW